MEYIARYSLLVNGSVYGVKDIDFEAEDNEEAIEMALQTEEDCSSKRVEFLLDCIWDEYDNEIEWERK